MRTPVNRRTVAVSVLLTALALGTVACEEDGGIEDDVEREVEEDVENIGENIEEETDGQPD